MRICDARSKEKCIALELNGGENTLMQMGILTPVTCRRIIDKNVNVLIREYDAKIKEKEIIEDKVGTKAEWVDKEVRNCFIGRVGISTLKCVTGYNHHGCRNNKINSGLTNDKCPICGEIEGWEHVIHCQGIGHMKEAYAIDLENVLRKIKGVQNKWEAVRYILNNIIKYVQNQDEELLTTQQLIGMDLIFKG